MPLDEGPPPWGEQEGERSRQSVPPGRLRVDPHRVDDSQEAAGTHKHECMERSALEWVKDGGQDGGTRGPNTSELL